MRVGLGGMGRQPRAEQSRIGQAYRKVSEVKLHTAAVVPVVVVAAVVDVVVAAVRVVS
jgi:hypothetical protein